jgi:hypothetical protein
MAFSLRRKRIVYSYFVLFIALSILVLAVRYAPSL